MKNISKLILASGLFTVAFACQGQTKQQQEQKEQQQERQQNQNNEGSSSTSSLDKPASRPAAEAQKAAPPNPSLGKNTGPSASVVEKSASAAQPVTEKAPEKKATPLAEKQTTSSINEKPVPAPVALEPRPSSPVTSGGISSQPAPQVKKENSAKTAASAVSESQNAPAQAK